VVAAEMIILPLVFGLVWYALLFGVLNGLITYWRIKTEDDALRPAER
jgi:methyltransferase